MALTYLAHRPRTRHEVRRKLQERGFDATVAAACLDRLAELDLVDDEAFVILYVRDRIAHRPMGLRRLVDELYRKGIDRRRSEPIIARVFEAEGVDERSLAERAAERGVRRLRRNDDAGSRRRRLQTFLGRRGFDWGLIREVVDRRLPPPSGSP